MYPKSPAKRRWGIHRANILPPSGGPAPAQGLLPEQLHRGIVLQRLGPCAGMPTPAPRRCPPPANACHLPCPLQPETSRRWTSAAVIRRMACSPAKPRGAADCVISTGRPTTGCCAELGLDSRTVSKWAQNLRRRPQARPGLRQRCQKRPSEGRVPLGGTIGTPSGTLIPHTLPLRKNEAAKLAKNFAKRVIPTPQTRFRRLSGEISPKRMRNLPVDAKNFAKRIQNGLKVAAEEHVSGKSRPIGAETPFEKQKCTRKSRSSPRARACGTHQHHRMPHALPLQGKRTYNVPTYNWQRLAARVRRCLVAAGE